jgi:II/X family phage/plasmid replication protein
MIDGFKFVVKYDHIPFGEKQTLTNARGGKWQRRRPQLIHIDAYNSDVEVRSIRKGTEIAIWCSPASLFQRHNLFGSDKVVPLCLDVAEVVLSILHEQFGTSRLDGPLREQQIKVQRIDINYQTRHSTLDEVRQIMKQISVSLNNRGIDIATYKRHKTVYARQRSRYSSWKWYSKYWHFMDTDALPEDLPQRERLLKYAKPRLRWELTLRSKALRRLGLDSLGAWREVSAKKVFISELQKLKLSGLVNCSLPKAIVENLSPGDCRLYRLWQLGDDPADYCTAKTLRAASRRFANLGIDLTSTRPKPCEQRISLSTLSAPENFRCWVPSWAVRDGLFYKPGAERT